MQALAKTSGTGELKRGNISNVECLKKYLDIVLYKPATLIGTVQCITSVTNIKIRKYILAWYDIVMWYVVPDRLIKVFHSLLVA